MSANETNATIMPGGMAQFNFLAPGGSAGDHTFTGVVSTDKLVLVQSMNFATGVPATVSDLTSEFSVDSDDTLNNTSGTATTGMLLMATVARTVPND